MDNNLDQSKDFLFYSSNDGRIKVQVILIRQNEMYRFCKTKCNFLVQNEMC